MFFFLQSNSVELGLPKDLSHYNIIRNNVFGPGVTAEGVDIKEFTTKGKVLFNKFDGTNLSGENGAVSMVVVKGNDWDVANNQAKNIKDHQVGFKVVRLAAYQGANNFLGKNKYTGLKPDSVCIYVDPAAPGNRVSCSNSAIGFQRRAARMCNCNAGCNDGRGATIGGAELAQPSYTIPEQENQVESKRIEYD